MSTTCIVSLLSDVRAALCCTLSSSHMQPRRTLSSSTVTWNSYSTKEPNGVRSPQKVVRTREGLDRSKYKTVHHPDRTRVPHIIDVDSSYHGWCPCSISPAYAYNSPSVKSTAHRRIPGHSLRLLRSEPIIAGLIVSTRRRSEEL